MLYKPWFFSVLYYFILCFYRLYFILLLHPVRASTEVSAENHRCSLLQFYAEHEPFLHCTQHRKSAFIFFPFVCVQFPNAKTLRNTEHSPLLKSSANFTFDKIEIGSCNVIHHLIGDFVF